MAILKNLLRLAIIVFIATATANAENLQLQEKEIQAGLLYNFLKYTNWPDSKKGDVIQVCIIGRDPFGGHLSQMAGRTVKRKNITVDNISDVSKIAGCHIAVSSKPDEWTELSTMAVANMVLTVSTTQGFSENGGMIEFGRKGDRINVSLNIGNVRNAGLAVEDRLIRLVTVVGSGN